ncbi:hypothetical protein ACLNGM_11255 [Aureimonas phyllosphaerae]|uniref:hypothetical protein n=1 Tax=Aureimonas phyllosphaerae TaxID=1166078 RepID=UPI003A5BB582
MTKNQTTTAASGPTLTQQELFAVFAERHGVVAFKGGNDAFRELAGRIMTDAGKESTPLVFLSNLVDSVLELRWSLQEAFSGFYNFTAAHALSDAEPEDRYRVPTASDTLAHSLRGQRAPDSVALLGSAGDR